MARHLSSFQMRLMMYALKLSENSRPNFNKYEWFALISALVHIRFHGLANKLRMTIGTAERGCHVPLIWCDDTALIAETRLSPKTYRRHRDALKEAGFLFEI